MMRTAKVAKMLRGWRRRLERLVLPDVWRLRRQMRRSRKAYEADIAAASGMKRQELLSELYAEMEEPESELARIETTKWLHRASRYNIREPQRPDGEQSNDYWEIDRWSGRHIITNEGKAEIRKGVREELDWRRQRWTAWAGVLSGILTAVAAFLGAWLGSK